MNVMIDLETFGLVPSSAIKTIGAVKFGIVDGKPTIIDRFYKRIDIASAMAAGLVVDGPTVEWWMTQSDEARKEMTLPGENLFYVLQAFQFWLGEDVEIWGNGAAFDNVLLERAYAAVDMKATWAHRKSLCYRTIKNANRDMPIDPYWVGTRHNAVDDAESQAMHLMAIWARDTRRNQFDFSEDELLLLKEAASKLGFQFSGWARLHLLDAACQILS